MNLEQLEKLAKNPNYILSEKQLALLYQLRAEQYKPFIKEHSEIKKNDYKVTKINN